MILYLLQASACMITLYGIYHLLYSQLTFFEKNRGYLLSALILSLFIPWAAPFLELKLSEPPIAHWSYIYHYESTPFTSSEKNSLNIQSTFWAVLYTIYWIGVVFAFARLTYGLYKIYTYYKNGREKTFQNVPFVETEAVHLPFSFMNKIFVSQHVPLTKDIATILDHEVVHIRQWHSLDILFAEVIHAFFWFNPVVILYKRSLKQAHEFLADKIVAEKVSPSQYSLILLSQKQTGLELALTQPFFNSLIKKRIDVMTHHKSHLRTQWRYLAIVPIWVLLFFFFSSCQVKEEIPPSPPAIPQTPTPPPAPANPETMEDMPRFPGCEHLSDKEEKNQCSHTAMMTFISQNLKYPESAKTEGIEGTVVVQFTVDTDGSLTDIDVIKDIGGGCGEAARDVVEEMNQMTEKFIPGRQDGQAVKVILTLPFRFKL